MYLGPNDGMKFLHFPKKNSAMTSVRRLLSLKAESGKEEEHRNR